MNDNETSKRNNTKNKATSGISGFVEFIGWATIISGLTISLFLRSNDVDILSALLPALVATTSGLFFIMGAQITRATLDTANNTKKILSILSKQNKH